MSTKSLTIVKYSREASSKELVVIYKQFDGYPKGIGMGLVNMLEGYRIFKHEDGMNALATQLVLEFGCEFRGQVNQILLFPSGKPREILVEFIYYIYPDSNGIIRIQIVEPYFETDSNTGEKILLEHETFDGTPTELKEWILNLV